MKTEGRLQLYIHIPFCVRKCAYCDFLSFPANQETMQSYVDALCREISMAASHIDQEDIIGTVFLGGGTPSILTGEQIAHILETVRDQFVLADEAEITTECNPGTADVHKLKAMRQSGINRISFGLQSADAGELAMLERIHTWNDFENSFRLAREAGFDNINVDLIFGLPGAGKKPDPKLFRQSLQRVLALHPEHISTYSLMVEENTPISVRIKEGELILPDEGEDRKQYRNAARLLKSYGYEQYEISNFALPGYACRHNEGYWTGAEYLGFGLGASGYYKGIRYRNETDPEAYTGRLDTPGYVSFAPAAADTHAVTDKEKIEEYMFLGLRRTAGVSISEFRSRFHMDMEEVYGEALQRLRAERLIKRIKDRICLTAKGVDVSNYALASFMLDALPLPVYRVSVRDMVEFMFRQGDLDRISVSGGSVIEAMQLGAAIHRKLQSERPLSYESEVPLSVTLELSEVRLTVEGRADGILTTSDEVPVIEEIKSVSETVRRQDGPKEVHLAQAKCYAAIYAQEHALQEIVVRITYYQTESKKIIQWDESYESGALWEWFLTLTRSYEKWAALRVRDQQMRDRSIETLTFPFEYRKGQKRLVSGIYRTIRQGKQLFVQAPTGSGKTLAALYPSVRAIGEGLITRVWYLTARTVTRTVAQEAMSIMARQGLSMRSVTLTSRERICLSGDAVCDPALCPYAKGHFDRVNEALFELLSGGWLLDRQTICEVAGKHQVCPYALERDASGFADVVICDYNYVLDPEARLQDYFLNGRKKSDLFLIDEAHNLIERAREMYSACIDKADVLALRRVLKKLDDAGSAAQALVHKLNALNKELLNFKSEPFELVSLSLEDLPVDLLSSLHFAMDRFLELCEKKSEPVPEEFWDLYFELLHFINMFEAADKRFCAYAQTGRRGSVSLHLYCLDPSQMISSYLMQGTASVFYSATLLPIPYYERLLTSSEDPYDMYADSPFDPEHLHILIGRDVTSLYRARGESMYQRFARYITEAVSVKPGHYMVYFPSYMFMEQVCAYLPVEESGWMMQRSDMTEQEKEQFLSLFENDDRDETLVGLCVLGGAFSEGIDLTGQKLIGVIVIGTGIPQVGNRLNLTKDYFDGQQMDGFSYTYVYPGFNKVMQAVGRVIRTAEDVGFALLLDERFTQSRYRRLFPREWKVIETCDVESVAGKLRQFWGDQT